MDADVAHVRAALLQRYGMQAADIALLDAGSTPNYKVTTQDGAQVLVKALRGRLGAWVAANACQITTLAAHATSHGLPTPVPVYAVDGTLVACESGPGEGEDTHFVVFEWAVGYQRSDIIIAGDPASATAILERLGEILAALHMVPLPSSITLEAADAPGSHALCDMGTWLQQAGDPTALFRSQDAGDALWFRSWLPKIADFWKALPEPTVLCHGDPYLDNVLAKSGGDGPDIMLLDWEDSCASHPVVDLGACAVGTCFTLCLGEGSEDVPVELVKCRLTALTAGYQRKRLLSTAERMLLRPAMQTCAWACGAFRYSRFLEGVTDVKTQKYGQLIQVVQILEEMGSTFEAIAFP